MKQVFQIIRDSRVFIEHIVQESLPPQNESFYRQMSQDRTDLGLGHHTFHAFQENRGHGVRIRKSYCVIRASAAYRSNVALSTLNLHMLVTDSSLVIGQPLSLQPFLIFSLISQVTRFSIRSRLCGSHSSHSQIKEYSKVY